MVFNWISFLEDHKIPYVTKGPNVATGNVNIKCVFCGDDDPSEHLGLNITGGMWGCWRNPKHRGRLPHWLIMRLLGCSYEVADSFVIGGRELSRFDDLAKKFKGSEDHPQKLSGGVTLEFPKEIRPLTTRGLGRFYFAYLQKRGFGKTEISKLAERYALRFSTQGYWRGRIIFPIYLEDCLACWTGRTIYHNQELRYLSLSDKIREGSDHPLALRNVKDLVWNYDALMASEQKVIAVTEGPLDALKIDFYGKAIGVRATCLFGTGVTEDQKLLLADLKSRCRSLVVIPDRGALLNEMQLVSELTTLHPKVLHVPKGVEDPGALSKSQVRELFRGVV